jgi:hypothetical protein
MKRKMFISCVCGLSAVLVLNSQLFAKAKNESEPVSSSSRPEKKSNVASVLMKNMKTNTFDVYSDKGPRTNHYIPSGYMGDYSDIKVDENCKTNPHGGTTCIKVIYSNKASQGANWAGLYWQSPANNWGTRPGGYDLTGAKRVTFWARGEKGGEVLSEVKIGGITGEYADSDAVSIYDVELTKEWKKYVIDLKDLDLSYISGGFCWAANLDANPDGFTLYLDDIVYEFK